MNKFNDEWATRERIIKLELREARQNLREAKHALASDMKELKQEIAKGPSDWNCDTINNMSLCAQDRAKEVKACELDIANLIEELETNTFRKYID